MLSARGVLLLNINNTHVILQLSDSGMLILCHYLWTKMTMKACLVKEKGLNLHILNNLKYQI